MSTQPEALRLDDERSAIALRALHETLLGMRADRIKELEAENEALKRAVFEIETKLGVRGYECQIADLEAKNKALRADAERLDWCISVLYGGNWLTTDVGCGCCGESREFAADITGRAAIDVARGEK